MARKLMVVVGSAAVGFAGVASIRSAQACSCIGDLLEYKRLTRVDSFGDSEDLDPNWDHVEAVRYRVDGGVELIGESCQPLFIGSPQ